MLHGIRAQQIPRTQLRAECTEKNGEAQHQRYEESFFSHGYHIGGRIYATMWFYTCILEEKSRQPFLSIVQGRFVFDDR
jgi:hypothetical protein